MRVATWNVNSIRARLPRLLAWLEERQPDVVCLQETKVVDQEFPFAEVEGLGYQVASFGQKTYNGVAILSRLPMERVERGLPGDRSGEARLVTAQVAGVTVACLYVPNGQEVGTEKYAFKLQWMAHLRAFLAQRFTPQDLLILCGDFNVAPEDRDVWDPELWRGKILFSEPEKQAFFDLLQWGLVDCLRLHHPEAGLYTWWDYRQGAFHRGWGMRLDHILATPPMARRCSEVTIDRNARKGDKPSDHAPVLARFD
ncbi:MAG: exodeoxyribonuclease III [Thermoanaerobaculum sp.]|nr:exodeoxyribonuclease III [Thermoanaerobaculum sp.]MDW7967086.1 exodeoxyribonuclease III [Thermoanaerobaculum sp.]